MPSVISHGQQITYFLTVFFLHYYIILIISSRHKAIATIRPDTFSASFHFRDCTTISAADIIGHMTATIPRCRHASHARLSRLSDAAAADAAALRRFAVSFFIPLASHFLIAAMMGCRITDCDTSSRHITGRLPLRLINRYH